MDLNALVEDYIHLGQFRPEFSKCGKPLGTCIVLVNTLLIDLLD